MSNKAAEITKIGINCFLTTKISYANMMGDLMVRAGIEEEIDVVLGAIGGDSRIGKKYMKYGFGFGGPCLPRDNRALGHYSKNLGSELNLPFTVDEFNKEHAIFLKEYFIKQNPNKSIPFVMKYITYKPGTDILDESQQFKLCIDLLDEGYINDNLNNKISFAKSIVILTSNVGHDKKQAVSMGFINDSPPAHEIYKDSVKKYLKPEFVARLNNILVFNELGDKEFESIINFEISTIQNKLKQQNIKITFNKSIAEFILNSLKKEKLHARSIKDFVRNKLQVPISKFIIQNSKKSQISVKIVDNSINIG